MNKKSRMIFGRYHKDLYSQDDYKRSIAEERVNYYYELGFEHIISLSAVQGIGIEALLEEITKDITLSKVTIPSVTSSIYDKTGYIKLSTFASNSLDQFKEQLKELEDKKINGLIIDLRGNGGGLLNSASDIASLFIEKGK